MLVYSSIEDVRERLPAGAELDAGLVCGLLEEATLLVEGYLNRSFADGEIPDAVRVVTARMVARVLSFDDEVPINAESVTGQAGPFSQTFRYSDGASGGSPWLTAVDKTALSRFRRRRRGVYSMRLG